jgi:hypothetical protein
MRGWAVGEWGTVLSTVDGGKTWTSRETGLWEDFTSVAFTDAYHGWIVGSYGTLMVTSDGGKHWAKHSTGTLNDLVGVAFTDPSHGWILGDGPTLMRYRKASPTTLGIAGGTTRTLRYKATYKLSGNLSAYGRGCAGQKVILQSAYPGRSFKDVANTTTDSYGSFTFSVSPTRKKYYRIRFGGTADYRKAGPTASITVLPKVRVTTPVAPSTMYRNSRKTVSGYMKPRHKAGTYPVRIYKWKKTSSGKWKSYGYSKAKVADYRSYSKYRVSVKLPESGKWRLRAYAPADSRHAASWSSGYDYVMVP